MSVIELLEIIRINICSIIIFLPTIFIHSRRTCRIRTISHIPHCIIRISGYIISINRQYFPMLILSSGTYTTVKIDFPVFNRFENQLQLIRIKIFLTVLLSTIFHLLHFALIHRESIRIISRMYRPFTS